MSDWFADFLASGTVNRETVDIHNDLALVGRIQKLIDQYDELSKSAGERSVGESDPMAAIEAELEELDKQYEASKMRVVVGPVTEPDRQSIIDANPLPTAPATPPQNEGEAREQFRARLNEYQREVKRIELERDIAFAATSVVNVTYNGTTHDGMSVENVRALRNRPHGKSQFEDLLSAAIRVSKGEVEIARPKSRTSSTDETA